MFDEFKPGAALVITPAQACTALGCGPTKLWALIKAGELQAFLDGNRRRITTASVREYLSRKLASAPARKPVPARKARGRETATA
jgi:excisionase family DNA binding protein